MNIHEYHDMLRKKVDEAYRVATEARKKGYDPEKYVEIKRAKDLASRVEGLLGIEGIKETIEKLEEGGMERSMIAFEMVKKISRGELIRRSEEERLETAVRVGTAILTDGVLVAPTEGISAVRIKEDIGMKYVSISYAGPIRSAGGTVAALTVLLADVARRELNIPAFKPDEEEIERIVEEIGIYHNRVARLQYYPKDENHIREVLKNSPVCIEGDPTDKVEVSVHRNHPRVKTNRIRGGVALVICEGLLQKAAKVYKFAKKLGLDEWLFIKELAPVKSTDVKADVYLGGLVVGRPVLAYPATKGGFRVRYGRTFTTGIMSKAIHPAVMELTDHFIVYGTQLKVERPGKGMVATTCDEIDGPIVKLKDGSVRKVRSREEAIKIKDDVKEIIHLGDILIAVGDFIKSNSNLLPPGYVEEIWRAEVKHRGVEVNEPKSVGEAFRLSREKSLPLHPSALLYWTELNKEQLKELYFYVKGKGPEPFKLEVKEEKRYLELLGVEHGVVDGEIIIEEPYSIILYEMLGKYSEEEFEKAFEGENVLDTLRKLTGLDIRDKGGTYIGARMARPEKAKMRAMAGKSTALFPTGETVRSLTKIYNKKKATSRNGDIEADIQLYKCPKCGEKVPYAICPYCEVETVALPLTKGKKETFDFVKLFDKMREKIGLSGDVVGVKGLVSDKKIAERLEKGFLRTKYKITPFKDGTIRFDATDVPLTHFYANDIGIPIEKLRELGYTHDVYGKPLENGEQIVELFPQDILVSEEFVDDIVNTAKYVDELLEKLYGMPPYYNVGRKEDLVGKLIIGLSPHTSAGNIGRIIGFTKARVGYAHPYFHTAKRRNTDGDEDGIMLLMDGLLNFSRAYLGTRRGGTMDAPIVLNVIINPEEVDDEVHVMDITWGYPWEFYEKAYEMASPSSVKIELVGDRLGKDEQYRGLGFTHSGARLQDGPTETAYSQLKSVPEKAEVEVKMMKKIRAVDLKDAVERIILSHLIPDMYGNLRNFARQEFRCTKCNEKYRRVPLKGKCLKCGHDLTLTIHKGGIEKYIDVALGLAKEHGLSHYLIHRIELVRDEVNNIFEDEHIKQRGISDFFTQG